MADQGFGTTITFQSGLFGEVKAANFSGLTRDELDTTHMTTTNGWMTFIPSDLKNAGEVSVEIHWHPHTKMAAIKTAMTAAAETITITAPVPTGGSSGATFACSGFMKSCDMGLPHDGLMTSTCVLKFTGEPTMTAGT